MNPARILLRPIEATDLPEVFRGFSTPEVTIYYGLSYATLDACREQMAWYEQIIKENTGHWLALQSVADGRFMGAIGYHDYKDSCAELGYWLLPEYWGQGLMQEAAEYFLQQTFSNTGINRLYAEVEVPNMASHRLLERCGFIRQGPAIESECLFNPGNFVRIYQYELLRPQYLAAQASPPDYACLTPA